MDDRGLIGHRVIGKVLPCIDHRPWTGRHARFRGLAGTTGDYIRMSGEYSSVKDHGGSKQAREDCSDALLFAANLFRQLEVDGDFRLNLDRLTVKQIRLVFPLFHRIRGGFGQLGIAAQHFHVSDVAGF